MSEIVRVTRPEDLKDLPRNTTRVRIEGGLSSSDLTAAVGRLAQLPALQHLDVSHCRVLVSLPESLGQLSALQHLEVRDCDALVSLPESLGQLPALQHLEVRDCDALVSLPESLGQLPALQHLVVHYCRALKSLPESLGQLSALQHLVVHYCRALKSLPESLGQLSALQHLEVRSCDALVSLPKSLGQLSALQHLEVSHCSALLSLPGSLGQLPALQRLNLKDTPAAETIVKAVKSLLCITATALVDDLLEAYLAGIPQLAERVLQRTQEYQNVLDGASCVDERINSYWQDMEGFLRADAKHPGVLLRVLDAAACADDVIQLERCYGGPRRDTGDPMKSLSPGVVQQVLLLPPGQDIRVVLEQQHEHPAGRRDTDVLEKLRQTSVPPSLAAEWWHQSSSSLAEGEMLGRDVDDMVAALTQAVLAYLQQQQSQRQQQKEKAESMLNFLKHAVATIASVARSASRQKQQQQQEQQQGRQQQQQKYYYITDRKPKKDNTGNLFDFTRFLETSQSHKGQITLGPNFWTSLGPVPDWQLQSLNELHPAALGPGELLVFIHGYNTSFQDAVRSAVSLAANMGHAGPVVVYSWASFGSMLAYLVDKRRVNATVDRLRAALGALGQGRKLVVVAHSMGNEALTQALTQAVPDGHVLGDAGRDHELVFAAPDVSQSHFTERLGGSRAAGIKQRYTMYCCSRDIALWASRVLRFFVEPRAGDSSVVICRDPAVFDTIDCSYVRFDPTQDPRNHSYVSKDPSVAADIHRVARGHSTDARKQEGVERTLQEVSRQDLGIDEQLYIYPQRQHQYIPVS